MLTKQDTLTGMPFNIIDNLNIRESISEKNSLKSKILNKIIVFINPRKLMDEIRYLSLKKKKTNIISNMITCALIEKINSLGLKQILNPTLKMAFELTLQIDDDVFVLISKRRKHDFINLVYFIKQNYCVDQYSFTLPVCSDWMQPIELVKRDVLSPFGNAYFPESVFSNRRTNSLSLLYIRDFLKNKVNYKKAKLVSFEITPKLSIVD